LSRPTTATTLAYFHKKYIKKVTKVTQNEAGGLAAPRPRDAYAILHSYAGPAGLALINI